MGWVPSMAGNVARTDGGLLDLKGRDRSTARTVWTGLAALVVLFVAATLSTSILYPALTPVDEGAHVSYGYYLTTFDPPTVFDPLTGGSYTYRENRTVYTANHPPLYYSLLGPVVRGVNVVSDPSTAIHVGRLVSVAFGVMALVSLVGLASELMPKRPSAWLAAGAVGMLLPHVTVNSGFTYNDSAGLAMSLGVLWAGARILTAGPTNRRVLALAILSAAAALTRVSATPFAVVAVGLALAGALRRRGMPDRWRRVAAVVVVPGAVTAVFAGPIYLRNLRLYGDVTGGKALYELLGRHSRPMDGLFESPFMAARYRGLWVDLTFRVDTGPVHMVDRMSFALLWAGLALGVIAIALRTVRWWRGEARHELVVAGALAVVVAVVIWGFVQHVTGGGIAHSRYLLPAWPVYALLVAAGLRWLPPRVASAALTVGIVNCLASTALIANGVAGVYRMETDTRKHGSLVAGWREAVGTLGVPLGLLFGMIVVATPIALAAFLSSNLRLRRGERVECAPERSSATVDASMVVPEFAT